MAKHRYAGRELLWLAALIISSLVFACVTPFAAFSAFAAIYFRRRDAVMLVLGVWPSSKLA